MHLKYCQHEWSFWADNTRPHFSISLVLTGVWAHLSIHYSQYLHQGIFYHFFSVKVTTVELYLRTFFPQESNLVIPRLQMCTTTKRWLKSCRVLLYDLASKSGLMSLMPCSAATVMMWSRAFMWPNCFTTSLIWSLLADMGFIRSSMDKTHSITT